MDKKDKQILTNLLVSNLEEFYQNNGFERRLKGATRFENAELTVFWGASATFIDSLYFTPSFRVENIQIGSILKKIFPEKIGIEITISKVQSLELIQELDIKNFTSNYIQKSAHGVSYSYKVEKDTPLEPIVKDHYNFMTKVGLPFFEKVDSLKGINDFLNGRVLKGDIDYFQSEERVKELRPFFSQREVLSGVTCAYLINNPKIKELLNRYRIFFECNNYVLEPMEKVVEYFNQKKE